jgi:iron transport multicopper oxidase
MYLLPQIAGGFLLFASGATAYASIGPTASLFIGNKAIQPDGFSRS